MDVRAIASNRVTEYDGTGVEILIATYNVESFARFSLQIEAGDVDTTVRVESRIHPSATKDSPDPVVATLVGAGTQNKLMDKFNVEGIAEIKVYANGAAASTLHKSIHLGK